MRAVLPTHLKRALNELDRMDLGQRVRLGDELHERQPNLLASFLVLRNLGASDLQLEIALHVLLVTWLAMKHSERSWPLVTETLQETCLQRLTGRMRFTEGLTGELMQRALQDQIEAHREKTLLAFALGHLRDAGLLGIRTDAEKFTVLAVLNLVECVAHVAHVTPQRTAARHPPSGSRR